jgi:hypothetical protein
MANKDRNPGNQGESRRERDNAAAPPAESERLQRERGTQRDTEGDRSVADDRESDPSADLDDDDTLDEAESDEGGVAGGEADRRRSH